MFILLLLLLLPPLGCVFVPLVLVVGAVVPDDDEPPDWLAVVDADELEEATHWQLTSDCNLQFFDELSNINGDGHVLTTFWLNWSHC